MAQWTMTQARRRLAELVEAAARGERVVITRHGKPYIEIVASAAEVKETLAAASQDGPRP